ncbi:NPCBM/NEW2 domain-containing protein [Streptomyces sp. 7R007]
MNGALVTAGVGLLILGIYLFLVGVTNGEAETALIKMPGPLSARTRWMLSISGVLLMALGIVVPFTSDLFGEGSLEATADGVPSKDADGPVVASRTSSPAEAVSPAVESTPPASSYAASEASTYLNDLEPVGGENSFDEKGALDIDGVTYPYAMNFATTDSGDGATEKVEYDLGGRYKQFSVVLGLRDDAPETDGGPSACHWQILADGRELLSADTSRRSHFESGAKDISGVVHLAIIATQTKGVENPVPWPCTTGDARVS